MLRSHLASFMTIGVMWLTHHRLFTLINKKDDEPDVYSQPGDLPIWDSGEPLTYLADA